MERGAEVTERRVKAMDKGVKVTDKAEATER